MYFTIEGNIARSKLTRLEGRPEKEQVYGLKAWYKNADKDMSKKKLKICEAIGLQGIPALIFVVSFIYWSYGLSVYINPEF